MSKFKTGDRAMFRGETVTVLTDEVMDYYGGQRVHLVERASGGASLIVTGELEAAPRFTKGDTALFEGYRVKIMGGPYDGAGSMAGKVLYLVEYIDGPDAGKVRTLIDASLLPADDSSFGEDRYPRAGTYMDTTGALWRFVAATSGTAYDRMLSLHQGQRTLRQVAAAWGPLIRQR